jgi:hypothetical protein
MADFITDEEFAALPAEPAAAFIEFVRLARRRVQEHLNPPQEHVRLGKRLDEEVRRKFMYNVKVAADQFGIVEMQKWHPNIIVDGMSSYADFLDELEHCIIGLRLSLARRSKEYSVALEAAAKAKISHLLGQVREIVEKLEVSVAKKDRLFRLINAFQAEIDRERTTFQAFGALMIELCDDVGEAADRLEPAVRIVERIGQALGMSKRAEEHGKLPAPSETKRIEGPHK